MSTAYARAGVDTSEASAAVRGLVEVLGRIRIEGRKRSKLLSGHYANVLEVAPNLGVAVSTDGVGSKVVIAELTRRFDRVGVDCIAMNVNDVICVGAEPIAMVDYIAVQRAMPPMLRAIAEGLRIGAEEANIEIPGGEVAQLPELLQGHPPPYGFDLSGACFGTVALDRLITGDQLTPGDVIIGMPSSGVHANGLTLARRALLDDGRLMLDDRPDELEGDSVADVLLEPTRIYVRAVMALIRAELDVRGLAHITSDGFCNLLRLGDHVGYRIDDPLPELPVFKLVQRLGRVGRAEMYEVFNMGCGFCCIVSPESAHEASALLAEFHPGSRPIGHVTDAAGDLEMPSLGLAGNRHGIWAS